MNLSTLIVSALQRAEIAEMPLCQPAQNAFRKSVLFNEPKLLKCSSGVNQCCAGDNSVLFNEPKLLKCPASARPDARRSRLSALQRAEIAEMLFFGE